MGPVVSRLEKEFARQVEVRRYVLDKLVPGSSTHQEAFALAQAAGLKLTPTYLVVRSDGSVVSQFQGVNSYFTLRGALQQALASRLPMKDRQGP